MAAFSGSLLFGVAPLIPENRSVQRAFEPVPVSQNYPPVRKTIAPFYLGLFIPFKFSFFLLKGTSRKQYRRWRPRTDLGRKRVTEFLLSIPFQGSTGFSSSRVCGRSFCERLFAGKLTDSASKSTIRTPRIERPKCRLVYTWTIAKGMRARGIEDRKNEVF